MSQRGGEDLKGIEPLQVSKERWRDSRKELKET